MPNEVNQEIALNAAIEKQTNPVKNTEQRAIIH
jgi:hypothetical protein